MKIHHSPLTRRQLLAVLAALAAPLAPTVARAHSYKLGDIAVGHIWASAPESGEGVAVYGPILNRGDGAAQLTGASTPAAEQVRIRMATEGEEHWVDSILGGNAVRYSGEDGRSELASTLATIMSADEHRTISPDDVPQDWTAY